MDTSYNAASGDSQYKFLSEQLPGGILVPVARIAHGTAGAPLAVTPQTPLPVADPNILAALVGIATAAGQAAELLALQAVRDRLPATPPAQPLTDAQLRAAEVAISAAALPLPAGAATDAVLQAVRDRLPATPPAQPLTDAQLRAVEVAISAAALPLPAGAATDAVLQAVRDRLPALVSGLSPIRIGASAVAFDLVADNAGTLFSPASCAHAYGYDGSGNMTTDAASIGGVTRIKTYVFTSGRMTSESLWVVQ